MFKLYHQEDGTAELEAIFATGTITQVFLFEIAKVEFSSTIWKKVRTQEITSLQATLILECFEQDFSKYNFITPDSAILEQARQLITKYGIEGLRTLDSLQLSTCLSLKKQTELFLTADKLLKKLLELEGLPTEFSMP